MLCIYAQLAYGYTKGVKRGNRVSLFDHYGNALAVVAILSVTYGSWVIVPLDYIVRNKCPLFKHFYHQKKAIYPFIFGIFLLKNIIFPLNIHVVCRIDTIFHQKNIMLHYDIPYFIPRIHL